MERKFYHTDFEELIRDKADQYKMYPSDKVWKGIDKALRSRRKWYWSGFVLLLSGISYLAITELVSPATVKPVQKPAIEQKQQQPATVQQLTPFGTPVIINRPLLADNNDEITSDFSMDENGEVTAAFDIPLKLLPGTANADPNDKASVLIRGLAPLSSHEQYNFELSWPTNNTLSHVASPVESAVDNKVSEAEKVRINWLLDNASFKIPETKSRKISWQLAFAPTVNYRRLSGSNNAKLISSASGVPVAAQISGDLDNIMNHKPALGFELGTHGLLKLNKKFTAKAGLQFNYSKYDIRAFKGPHERTMIALNSQTGINPIYGYSDVRNFGGTEPEDLKNQYFQISVPVGIEFKVFGNDRLQLNIASTLQPTYLLNSNTYLISTDFKNYAKEPSLVRKWNMNAGAEAFIAYERGGVKWQVGPQFRYQLLSSYRKEYPIKEYLMEYGIKVGITKTIR